MVTVLLPTASRPDMLPYALQSIATQTALGKITRVVVSENGGNRASEKICADFAQLPITYLFRDPPVTPLQHGQRLMKECLEGDIIFILHDDDWWLPKHVETALAAFAAHPDAAAYGASYVVHQGSHVTDERTDATAWFGANYPPASEAIWRLSSTNVLLGSILGVMIHYSCLAARTEALRRASFIFNLGNNFDNDRMLGYALGQQGPLLFGHEPTGCVRIHASRDTESFSREIRMSRYAETTEWMVQLSRKDWSVVAGLFAQRIGRCPDETTRLFLIRQAFLRPWCLPEIARHLDRDANREFFAMYDLAQAKFAGQQLIFEH